jgi:hypothetical protein
MTSIQAARLLGEARGHAHKDHYHPGLLFIPSPGNMETKSEDGWERKETEDRIPGNTETTGREINENPSPQTTGKTTLGSQNPV